MNSNFNTPILTLDEFSKTITDHYSDSLCLVLVDENTRKNCMPHLHHISRLLRMPASLQNAQIIEIRSGEKEKNLQTYSLIIEKLLENNADRSSLLINVGGGAICDIGGFAASTYRRGIDFINIPTTLMAMVDAAHGGKTGVDFLNLKNQVGVFAPAKYVVIDVDFLNTLPTEEILSGFAEMMKIALVVSADFWNAIKNADLKNNQTLKPLIYQAIEKKMKIVENDPTEKNIRKILNFGHTFGHAFETFALENKEDISHGHAVAMGIWCELWLSEKILKFDAKLRQEISDFIYSKYPKFQIQATDLERLTTIILQDKKNSGNQIKPILLQKIGLPRFDLTCSKELCLEAFQAYIAS